MAQEIISMRHHYNKWVKGLEDLVAELPNDITMIEIGSYSGESTEIFLKSGKIKKMYCIDPWQTGYDDNDGASFSNMPMVERMFEDRILYDYPQVEKIKMPSWKARELFENESVDFVYIDGNHTYRYVKDDIKNFLPLIKKDGLIGGHDYTNDNHPGVRRAVDEVLSREKKTFMDTSWLYEVQK